MARKRPTTCKQCGKTSGHGRYVSYRSLCNYCAKANITTSINEMATKSGENYEKWLKARHAYIEAELERMRRGA